MRGYEALRSRLIVGMAAVGLAVVGTGLSGSWSTHAQDACGASAGDLFGTFVAHRTASDSGGDGSGQGNVTFSSPNRVDAVYQATRNGQTQATVKGSGTFSLQPLTGTERGTSAAGPAFRVHGMLVWGFTALLVDRLLALGGWERPWDTGRQEDLPPDVLDAAARS